MRLAEALRSVETKSNSSTRLSFTGVHVGCKLRKVMIFIYL
jgi:hypothetical protein